MSEKCVFIEAEDAERLRADNAELRSNLALAEAQGAEMHGQSTIQKIAQLQEEIVTAKAAAMVYKEDLISALKKSEERKAVLGKLEHVHVGNDIYECPFCHQDQATDHNENCDMETALSDTAPTDQQK